LRHWLKHAHTHLVWLDGSGCCVGKAVGDPDLDWLASYGFDVLVEAEVERATAHQTITLGTGTQFRIGQGDGTASVKGALPKGTARK